MIHTVPRPFSGQSISQSFGFQRPAALNPSRISVGIRRLLFKRVLVFAVYHVELPLARETVTVFYHLRYLIVRVYMYKRKRHVTEKRLSRKAKQNRAVLSYRPKHTKVSEIRICFAENVYAPRFELVKFRHN